jgi:type II secretory pathway pseudopilin PulG
MQSMVRYELRYHWNRRRRTVVAAALLILIMTILAAGIILGWKTVIGWRALVDYINPEDATQRKEALQVYAVIVAGMIASITAAVGLANLRLTRKNLEQQRELEAERAQGTALQTYYEQMGKLLTEQELRTTENQEVRELARAQTLTLLRDLDARRKGSVMVFLKSAGLIETEHPTIVLADADLRKADLREADLREADLEQTYLREADLRGAILWHANLRYADLKGAKVTKRQLAAARY